MLNRCKELKKLLRSNDLLLKSARATYDQQKQGMVQEAKTTLTVVIRHFRF
jgi:hypothetical protein